MVMMIHLAERPRLLSINVPTSYVYLTSSTVRGTGPGSLPYLFYAAVMQLSSSCERGAPIIMTHADREAAMCADEGWTSQKTASSPDVSTSACRYSCLSLCSFSLAAHS